MYVILIMYIYFLVVNQVDKDVYKYKDHYSERFITFYKLNIVYSKANIIVDIKLKSFEKYQVLNK